MRLLVKVHLHTPPFITIDGIKGKFYSRVYHVVVNYITDFAKDEEMVDWLKDLLDLNS